MDFINGEDRILYIKFNGNYTPIGCLTGSTFDESSEMLDTTTRDNNGWKTSVPTNQNYSIGFSGLMVNSTVIGGNFGVSSHDKLKLFKRNKTRIEWKLQGTKYPIVDYGFGYISQIGSTENVGEFMTFTGTIDGYGIPLVTSIGTVLLNNGNPNVIIQTDDTGEELLRVSKF